MQLRKAALRLLIGSIVVSGLLAIAALLTGEFGPLQGKILLSALATSGASIIGMACGAAWDQQRWRTPAVVGLVLVVATLALTLFAFWVQPDPFETVMKAVGTGWLFSTAAAHACLLGLAATDHLLARIRLGAIVLAFILAFGIALLLWTTLYQDENAYFRGLGVVAVLMLVGSLSLPVAARLRGLPERVEADAAAGGTEVMCPGCGHVQTVALGQIRCRECHVTFRVELV